MKPTECDCYGRTQYRAADDPAQSCTIARSMVFGKSTNARWSIERTRRDHGLRVDDQRLREVSGQLKAMLPPTLQVTELDSLRGLEGPGPPPILVYSIN